MEGKMAKEMGVGSQEGQTNKPAQSPVDNGEKRSIPRTMEAHTEIVLGVAQRLGSSSDLKAELSAMEQNKEVRVSWSSGDINQLEQQGVEIPAAE